MEKHAVKKVYCLGLLNKLRRLGCRLASQGLYANALSNFPLNGVGFLAVFSFLRDSSHLLCLFSFDSRSISPQCRPLESVLSFYLSGNWNNHL